MVSLAKVNRSVWSGIRTRDPMSSNHLLFPTELSSHGEVDRNRTYASRARHPALSMSYNLKPSFGGTRTRKAHRASRDLASPDTRPSEGSADMIEFVEPGNGAKKITMKRQCRFQHVT